MFLGVLIHWVLEVYDVPTLIMLYVCTLVQFGCILVFKRVGATLVGLICH